MTPLFYLTAGAITLAAMLVCVFTYVATKRLEEIPELALETRKFFFAAAVLTGLGLIFTLSMMFYVFASDEAQRSTAKEVWDGTKTIVPPLIALVIGYYFGKTDGIRARGAEHKKEPNQPPEPTR